MNGMLHVSVMADIKNDRLAAVLTLLENYPSGIGRNICNVCYVLVLVDGRFGNACPGRRRCRSTSVSSRTTAM